MKTPADWDKWWDDFHAEHGRYPTWDELIEAVQRDAVGSMVEPMPEAEKLRDVSAAPRAWYGRAMEDLILSTLELCKSPAERFGLLESLYRGPLNVDADGNVVFDENGEPVYGPGLIDMKTYLRYLNMPMPTGPDP